MSRDFERRAWIIVGAMLIAAVIAHFAADAAVAQAAYASKLSRNQALQWATEFGEGGWWRMAPFGTAMVTNDTPRHVLSVIQIHKEKHHNQNKHFNLQFKL